MVEPALFTLISEVSPTLILPLMIPPFKSTEDSPANSNEEVPSFVDEEIIEPPVSTATVLFVIVII